MTGIGLSSDFVSREQGQVVESSFRSTSVEGPPFVVGLAAPFSLENVESLRRGFALACVDECFLTTLAEEPPNFLLSGPFF